MATKKQVPTTPASPQPAVKRSRPAARKSAAPAAGTPAPPATPPAAKAVAKTAPKEHKKADKLVRDSFTAPEADYALIDVLKQRALQGRRAAKKSELIRAGLRVLAGLSAKALVSQLNELAPVKTGRPKKGH